MSAPLSLGCTAPRSTNTMPRSVSARTAAGTSRRAEAHADQPLFPARLARSRRRLDQLQVERVARALEERAGGQHAEVPALRQDGESEERLVEVHPVARALGEDRLHHAEPVQPGQSGRPGIGGGQRHEVDIVDGEIPVAVDEVDEAVADAVDAGDVELHGRGVGLDLPGPELHRVAIREARVADAQGHGAEGRGAGRGVVEFTITFIPP